MLLRGLSLLPEVVRGPTVAHLEIARSRPLHACSSEEVYQVLPDHVCWDDADARDYVVCCHGTPERVLAGDIDLNNLPAG